MSPILRSFRFVRSFSSLARNVVLTRLHAPRHAVRESAWRKVENICLPLTKSYAFEAITSEPEPSVVEKSLYHLDHEVRMRGRISAKDIEEVLSAVIQTGVATSSQSLLLIRCCGNLAIEELPEVRTKLVKKVWKVFKDLQIPLDVSHYNALLKVYLENKHKFDPMEFLKMVESERIEPNRVTYQRLIGAFCLNGNISGATKILEIMKEKKIPITEAIFNYLITGHSEEGDMESAASILEIMRQKGIEPTAASFTNLLCGYAKHQNIDKLRETLKFCDEKDIFLLDKDYMEIIYELAAGGCDGEIDNILSRLKKSPGYNQDAINLMFRLLNLERDDVALKIVQTMVTYASAPLSRNGAFLIQYLVRNNRPISRVLHMCKELEKRGVNEGGLMIALKETLMCGNKNHAYHVMKQLKEEQHSLRPHYFWPLFCQAGSRKIKSEITEIISWMKSLQVPRTMQTIRNFIIPHFNPSDNFNVFKKEFKTLASAGVPVLSLAQETALHFLKTNNIVMAEIIVRNFVLNGFLRIGRRSLVQALFETNDVDAFVKILAHAYCDYDLSITSTEEAAADEAAEEDDSSSSSSSDDDDVKSESRWNKRHLLDAYISELLEPRLESNETVIPLILKGMLAKGIGITENAAKMIKDHLNTPEISALLEKLTSPDLELKPLEKGDDFKDIISYQGIRRTSETDIEESEKDRRRRLLVFAVRSKDVYKAESLFQEWLSKSSAEAEDYGGMIKLYSVIKDYDKALKMTRELQSKFPDAKLDVPTSLYIAEAFLQNDLIDEARTVIENIDETNSRLEFATELYGNILLRLTDKNPDIELLKDLIDLGIKKGITTAKSYSVLVAAHLNKNDLEGAVNQFSENVTKFRVLGWRISLFKKLIENENSELLEKATKASAEVFGQINSLIDLVSYFLEMGRVKEARKLMETPGLPLRSDRIDGICQRFLNQGYTSALEHFVSATRNLSKIDRPIIFDYLLRAYVQADNAESALSLWTQMQEEDVQLNDSFLQELGTFLKSKDVNVPFVIPKSVDEFDGFGGSTFTSNSYQERMIRNAITNALKTHDHKRAYFRLVDACSKDITLEQGIIFNVLNLLSSNGKYNEIKELRANYGHKIVINDFIWESHIATAYVKTNEANVYFNDFLTTLSSTPPENLEFVGNKFPRRSWFNLLINHPEVLDNFIEFAKTSASQGFSSPMNVLHAYYVVKQDFEKAVEIRDRHFGSEDPKNLGFVSNHLKNTNNNELFNKLINSPEKLNLNKDGVGFLLREYLTLLSQQQNLDEITSLLKKVEKEDLLSYIPSFRLSNLEKLFVKHQKPFPISISHLQEGQESSQETGDDEQQSERLKDVKGIKSKDDI